MEDTMQLVIGADHAGVEMKSEIIQLLQTLGHGYEDLGTWKDQPIDYPDIAKSVAGAVAAGRFEAGIIICGTGIGVSMTANKFKNIRAALCGDTFSARMSREHNQANILCLGARVLGMGLALDIVRIWLETPFSTEERHVRRVKKIDQMEC
jgi:ribose 5-phosphate isomerase B